MKQKTSGTETGEKEEMAMAPKITWYVSLATKSIWPHTFDTEEEARAFADQHDFSTVFSSEDAKRRPSESKAGSND